MNFIGGETGTSGSRIDSRFLWLTIGLVFLIWGLAIGVFSPSLSPLLFNSFSVVAGTLFFSLIVGGTTGWILGWTKIKGKFFWTSLVIAWAVCPLAVQLSAFDAMFGRRSWLALFAPVSYGRVIDGYWAVVIVHTLASIPWVILVLKSGRILADVAAEKASVLEMPWWKTMLWISLPRNIPLLLSAATLVALFVFQQFLVTDVYQVRTWAEVWYLSFSMEQNTLWDTLINVSPTELFPETWSGRPEHSEPKSESFQLWWPVLLIFSGIFCIVGACLKTWTGRGSEVNWMERWNAGSRSDLTVRHGILFVFVLMPVLFLFGSLVARAGVRAKVQDGSATMIWSADHFSEMFWYCTKDFADPIVWSSLIGISSAALISVVGLVLGWLVFRRSWAAVPVMILSTLSIAVPAPIVSLFCYESLFLSSSQWLVDLSSNSILGPVSALFFKGVGFSTIVFWTAFRMISTDTIDQAKLEGSGEIRLFWEFGVKGGAWFHLGFLLMAGFWASGDLAASFAVLPAGIDTVPRRILGDLHAGAGDKVAMICLIQLIAVVLIGIIGNFMARNAKFRA